MKRKVLRFLEVILHIGAHRTGTKSLQRTLYLNRQKLNKNGVTSWGPKITRGGVFSGLMRQGALENAESRGLVARNKGVVALRLEKLAAKGRDTLLVSDENILGGMRINLRSRTLYPDLRARLSLFQHVFGTTCTRIGLAIRPLEDYWASSLAYTMPSGQPALNCGALDRLVDGARSWRHVIADVVGAFPNAEILVWEFGRLIGRPQEQARLLSGGQLRLSPFTSQLNAAPGRSELREVLLRRGDIAGATGIAKGNGRFMPFTGQHIEHMRGVYQQDLHWLRAQNRNRLTFVDGPALGEVSATSNGTRGYG